MDTVREMERYSPHTLIPVAVPLRVQTLSLLISAARRLISHIIIVSQDSSRKPVPAAAYGREMCKRNRASDVRRPRRAFLAAPPVAAETNQIDESGTVTGYRLRVTSDGFQYVTRSWARLTPYVPEAGSIRPGRTQNTERHASRPHHHHHHHRPQHESRRCHLKTQARYRFVFS